MGGYLDRPLFPVNTLNLIFLTGPDEVQIELLRLFLRRRPYFHMGGEGPGFKERRERSLNRMKAARAASLRSYRRARECFKGWAHVLRRPEALIRSPRTGMVGRSFGPPPAPVPSKFQP